MLKNINPNLNGAQNDMNTIWYKEPWPWFIILILVVSFSWGIFQLTVAFKHADDAVIDDYYVEGKAVNLALQRDQLARALQLSAKLTFDDETGQIFVRLTGKLTQWPEKLKLSFLSAVIKKNDRILTLNRAPSGDYVGFIDQLLLGSYYIQLEPLLQNNVDSISEESVFQFEGWRLNSKAILSEEQLIYEIMAD